MDSGVAENHIIEIALDDRSNKELRDPDVILTMEEAEDKAEYLNSLFQKVYISDIVERHNVRNKAELDELVDVLASAIGSYTNQNKLVRTFKSVKNKSISDKTIKNYTDYLIDSYLISKADRYDIKGKKQLEVDFVATKGSEKYYIQSAFALPTADKVNQEQRGLLRISDFFRKIVVVGDNIKVRRDENGIITIGLRNFLLDENSLKL